MVQMAGHIGRFGMHHDGAPVARRQVPCHERWKVTIHTRPIHVVQWPFYPFFLSLILSKIPPEQSSESLLIFGLPHLPRIG